MYALPVDQSTLWNFSMMRHLARINCIKDLSILNYSLNCVQLHFSKIFSRVELAYIPYVHHAFSKDVINCHIKC